MSKQNRREDGFIFRTTNPESGTICSVSEPDFCGTKVLDISKDLFLEMT